MKTIWVATLNAGKFIAFFPFAKKWGILTSMGMLLLVLSCSDSDDLESVDKDSGIVKEIPADDDSSTDDGTSVDDDSTTDDETPIEEETTTDSNSLIIYTDIEPDFVGEKINDSYELDLNNDKIVDFFIGNSLYENWNWLGINAIRNDGIISVEPWYTHIVPIKSDSEIFDPLNQNVGQHYTSAGIISIEDCFGNEEALGCSFDWAGKHDRFIGLKIKIDGKIHFGWLRMEVTSVTQWVIKDYAYNATPNSTILAGQVE